MFTAFKKKMLGLYERSMIKRAFSSEVVPQSRSSINVQSRALSIDSKNKSDQDKRRAEINSKKKVIVPEEAEHEPSTAKKKAKIRNISRLIENQGPYEALISELNSLEEEKQNLKILKDEQITISDHKQCDENKMDQIQGEISLQLPKQVEISQELIKYEIKQIKQEEESPKMQIKPQKYHPSYQKKIPKECSICRKPLKLANSCQLACTHRLHKGCTQPMMWSMSYKCRICERAPTKN